MRLQDMNWMDVERYLERDNRIILITGATEQHAYLSLMTDILIPTRIAEAVAERENLIVAPPFNFGYSRTFVEYPGTISITLNTFDLVLLEIVESLLHQGFYRFLVINGHGGNQLPERLQDFQMEGLIRVLWFDWWRSRSARGVAERHGLRIDHANWGENFPFNRVSASPSTDKPPVNINQLEESISARRVLGDGNFGGLYQADDAIMQEMFDAVVDEAVHLAQQLSA